MTKANTIQIENSIVNGMHSSPFWKQNPTLNQTCVNSIACLFGTMGTNIHTADVNDALIDSICSQKFYLIKDYSY